MSEIWGPTEGHIRRGNATDTTGEHLVPLARVLEIVQQRIELFANEFEHYPANLRGVEAEVILCLLREEFE